LQAGFGLIRILFEIFGWLVHAQSSSQHQQRGLMASVPNGLPGIGCAGVDPDPTELAALSDIESVRAWTGITAAQYDALSDGLGAPRFVREIALITAGDWDRAIANLATSIATPVVKARFESLRRICRIRMGLAPGDRVGAPDFAPPGSAPLASIAPPPATRRKLKELVDHTLDVELQALSEASITLMFEKYQQQQGSAPSEGSEPTADQLSALNQLIVAKCLPYVCFSLFGAFGKRFLAKLFFYAHVLAADGSWQRKELPGPGYFDEWFGCYRVLRTGFLLLEQVGAQHIDNYSDLLRGLVAEFGQECWYIIYTGDVRMRSERMERIRREGAVAKAKDPAHPFDPLRPWDWVWSMASKDDTFWTREVRNPCILYLAKIKTSRESLGESGIQPQLPPVGMARTAPPEARASASARDSGAIRGGGASEHTHNKKDRPLCESYQTGACTNGPTCHLGAHQCAICLDTHPKAKHGRTVRDDGNHGREHQGNRREQPKRSRGSR
jgi:hypothetical protein